MLVFNTKQEQQNDVPGNMLNEIIIDYGYILFLTSATKLNRCLIAAFGLGAVWNSLELIREFQDFKTVMPQTSPNLQCTLD